MRFLENVNMFEINRALIKDQVKLIFLFYSNNLRIKN